MKASAYYKWQDCAWNASFKAESQLIFKWVTENQEAIFHQADESYRYATSPCFWAGLWTDFMEHLYRVRQLAAVMPLTLEDLLLSVEQYAMEFDSNYGPIEEPFRTYDDVWTLIYAGHSEYMDTTRKFTWTPDGYALNAASGELVPVDVPEIKSVRSIFSAVNSLAFDFEKKMLAMIMPSIRHCHPLGFLGVSSARRRRERVQVWAALSVETTICRFLNYAVRVLEGQALITLLRVFTILCLRRGTILLQLLPWPRRFLEKAIRGPEPGAKVFDPKHWTRIFICHDLITKCFELVVICNNVYYLLCSCWSVHVPSFWFKSISIKPSV